MKKGSKVQQTTKYIERWDGIDHILHWDVLIEKLNDKSGKYGKDLMKIMFNSDDSLSLTLTSMEFFDIK